MSEASTMTLNEARNLLAQLSFRGATGWGDELKQAAAVALAHLELIWPPNDIEVDGLREPVEFQYYERQFVRHNIAASCIVESGVRSRRSIRGGPHDGEMILTMYGHFWELATQNRTRYETHLFERPTFLDWLLRRRRRVGYLVERKEILLDPPRPDSGSMTLPIITMRKLEPDEKRDSDIPADTINAVAPRPLPLDD